MRSQENDVLALMPEPEFGAEPATVLEPKAEVELKSETAAEPETELSNKLSRSELALWIGFGLAGIAAWSGAVLFVVRALAHA